MQPKSTGRLSVDSFLLLHLLAAAATPCICISLPFASLVTGLGAWFVLLLLVPLAFFWIVTTPMAVLIMCWQKRYIGLVPPALYLTLLIAFVQIGQPSPRNIVAFVLLMAATFLVSIFSIFLQVCLIKKIRREMDEPSVKVLGCHSAQHLPIALNVDQRPLLHKFRRPAS